MFDMTQSLILILKYVLYWDALSLRLESSCSWWLKTIMMDIVMAHEHFSSQVASLPLPLPLLCHEVIMVTIMKAQLWKELLNALPELLDTFNLSLTQTSIWDMWSLSVSNWTPPKLLGKRTFQNESHIPTPASSTSKQIPDQHCSFNAMKMCSNSKSELSGKPSEHLTQEMVTLLKDELQNYYGPMLMPLPSIILTPNSHLEGYQWFYQMLVEVTSSQEVLRALHDLSSTGSEDESHLTKLMEVILNTAVEKLSLKIPTRVISSLALTIAKTDVAGIKSPKCNPDIIFWLWSRNLSDLQARPKFTHHMVWFSVSVK